MKSKRLVKRTYYNKTLDKYVTKTYEYEIKQGERSKLSHKRLIIYKSGKIQTKYISQIAEDLGKSYAQVLNELKEWVKEGRRKVSELAFTKALKDERIALMFANTGYSLDEAAEEIGTTVEALTTYANWNWHESIYHDPITGKAYRFEFNYEGAIFRMINE